MGVEAVPSGDAGSTGEMSSDSAAPPLLREALMSMRASGARARAARMPPRPSMARRRTLRALHRYSQKG